jgi:membrane protein implicated in regulation of membrane protease activity
VLLQLPGLLALIFLLKLIQRWFAIPEWLFWTSIAIWVVKDAILFPFVWRAYYSGRPEDEKMRGARGIAKERLAPSGYVFVRGELWKAVLMKGSPPIEEGEGVLVHAKEGSHLSCNPMKGSRLKLHDLGGTERGHALVFKFREGSASKSLKFKGVPQSL